MNTATRLPELHLEPSAEGVVPFASSAWPGAEAAGGCWLYANWLNQERRRLSFVSDVGKTPRVKRSVSFLLTLCLASSTVAVFARRCRARLLNPDFLAFTEGRKRLPPLSRHRRYLADWQLTPPFTLNVRPPAPVTRALTGAQDGGADFVSRFSGTTIRAHLRSPLFGKASGLLSIAD